MANFAKQNSNTQPQTKRAIAIEGGFQFEIKMAALIGLRGLYKGDDFELSSNIQGAGNFDDIMYKAGDRRYFLQLKHSDVGSCLEVDELTELLTKCFHSYCDIRKDFPDDPIKSEFIIYTNRELGKALSLHKKKKTHVDIFFKTCESKVFIFSPDNNENPDVYTLLRNSVEESKKDKVSDFLNKLIMATGQKGHREIDTVIVNELKANDNCQGNTVQYRTILHHFKTRVENWWRKQKTEIMTPKMLEFFLQKAKTEYFTPSINCLYQIYKEKFLKTNNKCFDEGVSSLQAKLSNNRAVHLTSDALTLCSILLMECVTKSKGIFVTFELLQSNKNMLFRAWLEGMWEYLIVFCDSIVQQSDISDTCLEIIKTDHSTKRVIILTKCSVPKIKDFDRVEHKFKFEQLSKKLQETLLEKKIEFQGCEVTMRSVLQRHGNVQHVLGPELVTDLITEGTTVSIGGCLQRKPERYTHRILKKNIWFSLDILKNRDTYPDIFAVSGMEKNKLVDFVPSEEKVGEFQFEEDSEIENSTQNNDVVGKRFIVLQGRDLKSSFSKLYENHRGETLHWLKHKGGKLLWKKTRGNNKNLLKSVDAKKTGRDKNNLRKCMKSGSCEVNEEDVWKLGERTVLVVAEPGMGKSSTTTQVAWHTKERDPTSWVVRINWNDHTGKLQDIDTEKFNIDPLVDFLCSAAFPESKYTATEKILLTQALENSGNVTVLMDGFDEISPTHADKATAILSEIMKSKVEKIWVTSRPVEKERLERMLSVIVFSMKKLSRKSQEEMFWDIWEDRANIKKKVFLNKYVKPILSQANDSDDQRYFIGRPFYFTITVSVYEDCLQKSLKDEGVSLPRNLNCLLLCDKLVTRKLHTYGTDKKREDLTNACVQDDKESLKEITLRNLEKCSLLVTMHSELNRLSEMDIESKIQPFVNRVKAGKDKIGIVMNVVDNRPQFVHRLLAEYFTARWFSKNFETNRDVMERILVDPKYGFVKNMLHRMLARGCPLHCAVLDWDNETVETLLEEGYDVNAVDRGGRTALHLIAAEGCDRPTCEEITGSLLRHGDFVDAKDQVLEWTALGYAIKTENWFVVESLLERKYKTTDLELIRQRVDDETYTGKIIEDIKDKNYRLLLQYLASICENTQGAP